MQEHEQKTLGEYLKHERLKRGISIDHVADTTRIRASVIEALEADRYDQLPPKAFFRGYIISYCQCIGIDHDFVLKHYRSTLSKPPVKRLHVDESLGGYTFERAGRSLPRWVIAAVVLCLIALGMLIMSLYHPSLLSSRFSDLFSSSTPIENPHPTQEKSDAATNDQTEETIPVENAAAVNPEQTIDTTLQRDSTPTTTSQSERSPEVVPENQPQSSSSTLKPDASDQTSLEPQRQPARQDDLNKGDTLPATRIFYKAVLRARRDVWLRYRIDDLPRTDIKLLAGRSIVMRAEQRILVLLQHESAVEVRIDNEPNYRNLHSTELTSLSSLAAFAHPHSMQSDLTLAFPSTNDFPPL